MKLPNLLGKKPDFRDELVKIVKDDLKSYQAEKVRNEHKIETAIDSLFAIQHPRFFEWIAARTLRGLPLSQCFVERTRDTIHIFYDGETGASLIFTPEGFEVRIPSKEWVENHIPTPTTSLIDRYPFVDAATKASNASPEKIIDLLYKAADLRKADYKECKYCKKTYPLEQRENEDVCMSCARTHLGVIY